jgi:hexosaminidase
MSPTRPMRTTAILFVLASVVGCASAPSRPAASATPATAGDETGIHVIPRPVSVARHSGEFVLSPTTRLAADGELRSVATRFARVLAPATGFDLMRNTSGSGPAIEFALDRTLLPSLGREGYRLHVAPDRIRITAGDSAGAFYATRTLLQLLPPEIFREAKVAGVSWSVPSVVIVDSSRFAWRGSHLDVSRHFMPKEFVKKHIDLLALHKLNTFHWHLTDDQGWRLEIKKYPRLTTVGAWRSETLVGRPTNNPATRVFDKKPHGGFYTQDDVREIVAYAAERFITVVPEIEMPGHSQAAIAAYPFLGNTTDSIAPWTMWGVTPNILNPSDTTIAFMKDVLTEVLALFPGPFIHIGGDEAPKTQWNASPVAQARIKALGLKDANELQSWFIKQMDAFLTAKGRRLVGWDEILEGGLAPNAVVMNWRSTQFGITAARERHDVIMTPNGKTYFDHYQARPTANEPLAFGGFLPIDTVYAYDPIPRELEPEFAKHIIGAQAQLWTEYMPNAKQVEYMAHPRMSALAEALWTPKARKDYADFRVRLTTHLRRLDALDVNYRRP